MDEVTREDLKKQLTTIDNKVSLVYYALMGNELTKDGGLIKRIDTIEQRMEKHEERIDKNENGLEKKNVYVNIIWVAAGALIGFIIKNIFDNL